MLLSQHLLPFLTGLILFTPDTIAASSQRHAPYKPTPVRSLFQRVPNRKQYPELRKAGPKPLAAWMKAYAAAKKAGKIAKAPLQVKDSDGYWLYPEGTNIGPKGICATSGITTDDERQCFAKEDVLTGPKGRLGISFDDGPQPSMAEVDSYLRQKNQTVTHFLCGQNIVEYPNIFKQTVHNGNEVAVHTWSHPQLPSLTDEQVIGEFGWTIQIIYDITGIIPAFHRPPFGAADNRIRSIATNVFGLTLIHWNRDTDDWCLSDDGTSACAHPKDENELVETLQEYIALPPKKLSTGLIILEHVKSFPAVRAFMKVYPSMSKHDWSPMPIGQMLNRRVRCPSLKSDEYP